MPSSREKLGQLVQELVAAEQAATLGEGVAAPDNASAKPAGAIRVAPSDPENSSRNDANRVTDCSFPLAVVNCANEPNSAEDNSDLSASNGGGGGKAEDTTTEQRGVSPKSDSQVKSDVSSGSMPNQGAQPQPSSDDSFASSNLFKANEALDRNVRFHNEKLASEGKAGKVKPAHKDDVTGAAVTANNASARLSSLQVKPGPPQGEEKKRKRKAYDSLEEQYSSSSSELMLDGLDKNRSKKNAPQNASDDSGYRESDQSVEDTSDDSSIARNGKWFVLRRNQNDSFHYCAFITYSIVSSSSLTGPRTRPLAPACNICLIRDDLTTIWCEVTSSIRTRSLKDESSDETMGPFEAKAASYNANTSADASKSGDEDRGEVKELLLCLRPIRDGEDMVDESLRFVPPSNVESSESDLLDSGDPSSASASEPNRPPKKRPMVSEPSSSSLSNESSKKPRVDGVGTEESAVESLMLMGNNAN